MSETLTMTEDGEKPPLYEPIVVPINEADVNEAMRLYMEFLELPDEIKHQFHYFDKERPRTSAAGYMNKIRSEPDAPTGGDNKFVFHYTPEFWQHQHDNIPYSHQPEVAKQFIDAADSIYYGLARAVKEKFKDWQEREEIPWLVGVHFPSDNKLRNHLRFLAYRNDNEDGILAKGHYDKSTATIAVAQSTGGLRIGEGPADLEPVQRDSFDPIMFRGFGWHQMHEMLGQTPQSIAAWHDAVESECENQFNEEIMRWAMIYFVNPAKIYLESSTEQTHTPIRWRNIGRLALPIDAKKTFLAA